MPPSCGRSSGLRPANGSSTETACNQRGRAITPDARGQASRPPSLLLTVGLGPSSGPQTRAVPQKPVAPWCWSHRCGRKNDVMKKIQTHIFSREAESLRTLWRFLRSASGGGVDSWTLLVVRAVVGLRGKTSKSKIFGPKLCLPAGAFLLGEWTAGLVLSLSARERTNESENFVVWRQRCAIDVYYCSSELARD